MLGDSYNLFLQSARKIPNFKIGTKEDCDDIQTLANGYCDAEATQDNELMGSYISALMVRYWYMIPFLYNQSVSLRVDREDMIDILYEAFLKAFKNKKWLDSNDKLSSDSHGAQKCIERCIDSVRLTHYQLANHNCRKINYITHSLDMVQEIYDDSSEELLVEDDAKDTLDVDMLINKYLLQNNVLCAMIIDCICYQEGLTKSNKLSIAKIVVNFDIDYYKYFVNTYKVSDDNITKIAQLAQMSKETLIKNIRKAVVLLREDTTINSIYVARCR